MHERVQLPKMLRAQYRPQPLNVLQNDPGPLFLKSQRMRAVPDFDSCRKRSGNPRPEDPRSEPRARSRATARSARTPWTHATRLESQCALLQSSRPAARRAETVLARAATSTAEHRSTQIKRAEISFRWGLFRRDR